VGGTANAGGSSAIAPNTRLLTRGIIACGRCGTGRLDLLAQEEFTTAYNAGGGFSSSGGKGAKSGKKNAAITLAAGAEGSSRAKGGKGGRKKKNAGAAADNASASAAPTAGNHGTMQRIVTSYLFRCNTCGTASAPPQNQNLPPLLLQLPSRAPESEKTITPYEDPNFRCPICGFGVVQIKNNVTNTKHSVCLYCFNNPPNFNDDGPVPAQMRCFQCRHQTCALAGGKPAVPVKKCGKCRSGKMVLKSKDNSWRISCDQFPKCKEVVWLPRVVEKAEVDGGTCAVCRGKKIKVTVSTGRMPPGYEAHYTNTSAVGGQAEIVLCPYCEKGTKLPQ